MYELKMKSVFICGCTLMLESSARLKNCIKTLSFQLKTLLNFKIMYKTGIPSLRYMPKHFLNIITQNI